MKIILFSLLLLPCSCEFYRNSCRAPPTVKADATTGKVTLQIGAANRHFGSIPSAVDLNITYYDTDTKSKETIANEHTVVGSFNMFLVSKANMETMVTAMGRDLTTDLKRSGVQSMGGLDVTNLITATFTPKSGVSNYTISLKNIDPKEYYDNVCTLELEVVTSYSTSTLMQYFTDVDYLAMYSVQTSNENEAMGVSWTILEDDWITIKENVSYVFRSSHNMQDVLLWASGVFSFNQRDVLKLDVTIEDQASEQAWKGNFVSPDYSNNEDDYLDELIYLLVGFSTMVGIMGIFFIAAVSVACVRGKICCK